MRKTGMADRWRKEIAGGASLTPADAHQAAQDRIKVVEATLMRWVTDAQRALENDKMDALARARLGELILNACRYLSEREEFHRKAALVAQSRADSEIRRAATFTRSA